METPITARSILTLDDFTLAMRVHHKAHTKQTTIKPTRLLLLIGLVRTTVMISFLLFGHRRQPMPPAGSNLDLYGALMAPGIAVIVIGGLLTWARLTTRRQFEKLTEDQLDQSWTIDEQGLLEQCPQVESSYRWDHFRKIIESSDLFLLYSTDQLFHILPTRAFPSTGSMNRFASLAQEHAKDYVVYARCVYPEKNPPAGLSDF